MISRKIITDESLIDKGWEGRKTTNVFTDMVDGGFFEKPMKEDVTSYRVGILSSTTPEVISVCVSFWLIPLFTSLKQ